MSTFQFKHFSVSQFDTTMKVGTDAMLLGSLVEADDPQSILDIGTGTGVVALMLAQRFENAQIIGLEIDEDASLGSGLNFKNSSWDDRISSLNADILQLEIDQKFDLIVSNPPYYENSLLSDDERTSRAKHAAFLPVASLLEKVKELLTNDGTFWVIIPFENTSSWVELAQAQGLFPSHAISIIGKEGQGAKRSVLAFQQNQSQTISNQLSVRDSENNYTKEYIELTKEFHDRDLSK